MNRPRDSIASAAPASTRLATLRQVLGDRRRAGSRLRRSLWVSLLAHLTLFFVALPIARHPEGDRAREAKAERAVQLITIEPPQPQVRPEPLEAPQPEPEPEPEPEALAERLEFLRSQREQQGKSPDSRRISTHDRSVQDERVARSRARVADGSQDRGKRAGSPSKASQAGSTPQLPAPSTPLEQSAQVQARSAPTQPRAPSAERPRLDERPCGGQAGAGPCDAVLQTRGDQGPALEPDAPQQAIARADQRLSTSPGRVSESGREGWSPLAVRAPGLAPDATPFARAILPDRTAPSDASKAAMVSDEATPTVKPAPSPTPRRPQQPKASRTARATGSAQDQPDETAQAAARPTVVEPAPSFDVEPLELMRQQQRRDSDAQATEQHHYRQERLASPGSARPSDPSPTGRQAAAGGHRVSAVSPPEVVDMQTALSTRQHPLAEVLTALDDQLREGWIIPLEIRVSGIVGTTGVRMVVDPRGRISEVALTRPSGHPHLDQLAQAAVPKRIDGFSRLLTAEARDAFPEQGLHLYYEFAYRDSPVVGVY
jgi:outer membrane biosynthesis protein TonB